MNPQVQQFVEEEFLARRPDVAVGPDDDLIERGVIDSVGLFRLISFLEESLGLVVSPADVVPENFGSLRSIDRFVAERSGA
jgi:acyl carrier protein